MWFWWDLAFYTGNLQLFHGKLTHPVSRADYYPCEVLADALAHKCQVCLPPLSPGKSPGCPSACRASHPSQLTETERHQSSISQDTQTPSAAWLKPLSCALLSRSRENFYLLLLSKTVTFPLSVPHKSTCLPFLISQHPYLLCLPQIHLVCCHSTGYCVCCCCFFPHKLWWFYFSLSAMIPYSHRNSETTTVKNNFLHCLVPN